MRIVISAAMFMLFITFSSISTAQSIAKKTYVTVDYNLAYNVRWSDKDKTWLFANFNKAWRTAVNKGELAKSALKPAIWTLNESSTDNCNGLDAFISENGRKLTFCSSFLVEVHKYKLFTIYHEVGHYAKGDFRDLDGLEYAQRECNAQVTAGKLLGRRYVIPLLKKSNYGDDNWKGIYIMADNEAIAVLGGKKKQCSIVPKK